MNFIEQFKTSGYDDGGFGVLRNRTDNVRNLLINSPFRLQIAQYRSGRTPSPTAAHIAR